MVSTLTSVNSEFGKQAIISDQSAGRRFSGRICNSRNDEYRQGIQAFVSRVMDYEELFLLPEIDWSEKRSISDCWAICDYLARQKRLVKDFEATYELFREVLFAWLRPLNDGQDEEGSVVEPPEGITIPTLLLHSVGDIGDVVESMLAVEGDETVATSDLLPRHTRNLDRNLTRASGGKPDDPRGLAFRTFPH